MADVLPPRRGPVAVVVLVTVYVTLLGPAAGLLWGAVAPKVSLPAIANASSAAFHPQIGADAWFLLIGGLAGAVAAALALLALRDDGPPVAIGLALGGALGAVVADRVGYLSERHETTTALRALGLHPGGSVVAELDFRIRALGVLTIWPLVSLLLLGVVVAVNAARR